MLKIKFVGLWIVCVFINHAVGQAREPSLNRIVISGPAGPYKIDQWKADWPGCAYEDGIKEQHATVVATPKDFALRVDYEIGEIGPERGGVGWRMPMEPTTEAQLNYSVTFSEDFDWVKGGKLPGLCGGPESVTGGNRANGDNGFSARLMWRKDGRGEAYVYHMNQPGNHGESFDFPSDFRFPTGRPVGIQMRLRLNDPGRRDGTLDVWVATSDDVAKQHVVSRSDMQWRKDPNLRIDGLLFETFHGGGDKSWAPRRESFAVFDDIHWTTH